MDFDPLQAQTHEPFSKTNANWSTDDKVKTPKKLPVVVGWNLMVRPIAIKKQTKGGIYLPEKSLSDIESFTNIGQVVAMGDLCYNEKERLGDTPWCKVGDYVVFHRHAGTRFRWQGIKMTLVPDDKIMLVLQDINDFDPTEDMSEFE